jgi:hypothetical protein
VSLLLLSLSNRYVTASGLEKKPAPPHRYISLLHSRTGSRSFLNRCRKYTKSKVVKSAILRRRAATDNFGKMVRAWRAQNYYARRILQYVVQVQQMASCTVGCAVIISPTKFLTFSSNRQNQSTESIDRINRLTHSINRNHRSLHPSSAIIIHPSRRNNRIHSSFPLALFILHFLSLYYDFDSHCCDIHPLLKHLPHSHSGR